MTTRPCSPASGREQVGDRDDQRARPVDVGFGRRPTQPHAHTRARQCRTGDDDGRVDVDRCAGRSLGDDVVDLRGRHVGGAHPDHPDREGTGRPRHAVEQHDGHVVEDARPVRRLERGPDPRHLLGAGRGRGHPERLDLVGQARRAEGGGHRRVGRVRGQRPLDRAPREHGFVVERGDHVAEEDLRSERILAVRADDVVEVDAERHVRHEVAALAAWGWPEVGPPLVAADVVEEEVDRVALLRAGRDPVRRERGDAHATHARGHAGRRERDGETRAQHRGHRRERVGRAHRPAPSSR